MGGGYEKVPSSTTVVGGPENIINPNAQATAAAMENLGSIQNLIMQQQPGLGLGYQQQLNQFLSGAPGLQNLVLDAAQPFNQALEQQANDLSRQAVEATAAGFSGLGALNTGAARQQAGAEVGKIFQDVALRQQANQQQMLGSLYGQALPQAFQTGARAQSLLGQTLGMQSRLGAPQFMDPYTYIQDQYQATPSPLGLIGAVAGGALGAYVGGPAGMQAGAGAGGQLGAGIGQML